MKFKIFYSERTVVAPVRRGTALRISLTATIDRATPRQSSHCGQPDRHEPADDRAAEDGLAGRPGLVCHRGSLGHLGPGLAHRDADVGLHGIGVLAKERVPAGLRLAAVELVGAEPVGSGPRRRLRLAETALRCLRLFCIA